MKAEVDAIDDANAALLFAFGCVWCSIKERTFNLAFVARSVRLATIGAMLALSALSAMMTKHMIDADAQSAFVFGLTSVFFAAAAGWSHLRGPKFLAQTAGSVIPFYILAFAFVSADHGRLGGWANARLYQALAIEGIVIWAALLTAAIFMLRVEALPIPESMS